MQLLMFMKRVYCRSYYQGGRKRSRKQKNINSASFSATYQVTNESKPTLRQLRFRAVWSGETIAFSDKACFHLDGYVSDYICQIWCWKTGKPSWHSWKTNAAKCFLIRPDHSVSFFFEHEAGQAVSFNRERFSMWILLVRIEAYPSQLTVVPTVWTVCCHMSHPQKQ